MEEGVVCPKCHKRNDIHKFCIYCGHKILDDDHLKSIIDNSKPHCLNCGKPVGKGQEKCECGYEFRDIKCPKCNSKNPYANRFCTECGEILWTSNVCEKGYDKIKWNGIRVKFPKELRNTMLYLRFTRAWGINFPNDTYNIGIDNQELQSNKLRLDNHLNEILARWKIISPNYCINCFSLMKPILSRCRKCSTDFSDAEKRIGDIKIKNYVQPVFDKVELKWNSKFTEYYLYSLAPDIGESQFEYRERLKWEYAENNHLKDKINSRLIYLEKNAERFKRERERDERLAQYRRENEERARRRKEYIRKYGGGYCDSHCKYYYSEIINSSGAATADHVDVIGEFHYCSLRHSVDFGSWCKDYE